MKDLPGARKCIISQFKKERKSRAAIIPNTDLIAYYTSRAPKSLHITSGIINPGGKAVQLSGQRDESVLSYHQHS